MSGASPDLRAGDADREAVADALTAHCSAGRITVAELEERLGKALSARTMSELEPLLADLPAVARTRPPPAEGTPVKVGLPGVRDFRQNHLVEADRETAFRQAVSTILPSMIRIGYRVTGRTEPELLVFELSERPGWVVVVCILAFPLGLLALLARDTHRVVLTFDEIAPDRTRIVVQGTARRGVRKAFAGLSWNA